MPNVRVALGLTLLAGMATGIGSVIAFAAKRTNYRFLSVATGFSAGVMLYVSFREILVESGAAMSAGCGAYWGPWANAAAFFGGMLLIGLVDGLIPAAENPHETHSERETAPLHDPKASLPKFAAEYAHEHGIQRGKLMRMGLFTALAIAIHNFPEGLATFLAALERPAVGLAVAVAIALHNIPEGISVSVPIFYATGNRKKAFAYSLLSGLAEPVGAALAYALMRLFIGGRTELLPPQLMGLALGGVAGVMVYISLDELLPTSRAYGKGHDSLLGLTAGMLCMAVSLLLMK
ncbi:MAG: zinc transporter ZupT [Elusimicrobia bacterium]|nr:zinc transporter ZupT [Elusimicrobiota bacterium]